MARIHVDTDDHGVDTDDHGVVWLSGHVRSSGGMTYRHRIVPNKAAP
jgi:hypothetical protein